MMLFIVLTVLPAALVHGFPDLYQYGAMKAENFIHEFEMPQTNTKTGAADGSHKASLKKFSFNDCGLKSSLVNIKSLSISPDPLGFPGPLTVAADFIVKGNLQSTLSAKLEVKKSVFGKFIKIPCIDGFGSCEYDDLCALLDGIPAGQCPDPLQKIGIDCKCPIKQGSYDLSKATFDIEASIIPSGDYQIQANVTHGAIDVACLELTVTLD